MAFETASKILRDAEVSDAGEKPRRPSLFWAEHLAWGAGGTCFARVAAFHALLSHLGFRARKVLGRVEEDFDHAALLVETKGGELLADVGFPLPALLPAREGERETPLATLRAAGTDRGLRVDFSGGVPEGPRGLEIFFPPVSEEEFGERWRRTFHPESRFLRGVWLRVQEEARAVSFSRGEVRIDDLHSRLRLPLASPRASRLEEIFGVDSEALSRAFAMAGDPEPEIADTVLTAYLEVAAAPDEAFAAIAAPDGYRALMEGVAEVTGQEPEGEGWGLTLRAPGPGGAQGEADARFTERVVPDRLARKLAVRRDYATRAYDSSFAVEERAGKTCLLRAVTLPGAREDLLRNDSARGRLAGTLAVDLLAWARMLS